MQWDSLIYDFVKENIFSQALESKTFQLDIPFCQPDTLIFFVKYERQPRSKDIEITVGSFCWRALFSHRML